jgi:hypothetical protein
MRVNVGEFSPPAVPDVDAAFIVGRDDILVVVEEGGGIEVEVVFGFYLALLCSVLDTPNAHGAVVAAGQQQIAVIGKGE